MDQLVYEELKSELESPLGLERKQSLTVISSTNFNAPTVEIFIVTEKQSISAKYACHRILSWVFQTSTPPFKRTFARFNQLTFDRFLDHCVKLAENELYA